MKSLKPLFFSLILAFLLVSLMPSAKADNPQIHVASSLETARTFDSVLIMITSDPLLYGQNSTIASNHTISFKFTNLGGQKEIYSEDLKLTAGIVTRTFLVDPNWGEFTGIIEVEDPLLDSVAITYIQIEYSTDWVLYLDNQMDLETNAKLVSGLKVVADQNSATVTIAFITTFVLIPMVLVKFQHTNARKRGDDSYWDRFVDRFLKYTLSNGRFYMYFEDPRYSHPQTGKGYYDAGHLLAQYDLMGEQVKEMKDARSDLRDDIDKLAPDMLEDN